MAVTIFFIATLRCSVSFARQYMYSLGSSLIRDFSSFLFFRFLVKMTIINRNQLMLYVALGNIAKILTTGPRLVYM